MRVVILAGGEGSRLFEATATRPKAMVDIGGKPLVWHVMSIFAHHGLRGFTIGLGYRGDVIRRELPRHCGRDFELRLIDTGRHTATGGRIKRLGQRLNETFVLSWCDGLANLDVGSLIAFHRAHGKSVTVTAVRPPERFGRMRLRHDRVHTFHEKGYARGEWINGGVFVVEPQVLSRISGDDASWEVDVLAELARIGELRAFRHHGFWQCMDTLHEKRLLEELWKGGAPWKVWLDDARAS